MQCEMLNSEGWWNGDCFSAVFGLLARPLRYGFPSRSW